MEFEIIIWMFCKAFPEQVHDFLAEFAPPNQDKESQVSSDTDLFTDNDKTHREGYYNGLFLLQRRIAEQNRVIKRPRNEHVPYLTPGNINIHLYIVCIIIIFLLPRDRNVHLFRGGVFKKVPFL